MASKIVLVPVVVDGLPETGLIPTIRIRDAETADLIVTDVNMTEIGDGWYKYLFLAFESNKNYAIRVDSTIIDAPDRFSFASNESIADIQEVLNQSAEPVADF